jgi:hypothetical protein
VQRTVTATGTATVNCLGNETATGGGFMTESGSVVTSRPVESSGVPVGWQARVLVGQVTVFVVCVPP